MKLGWQGDEHDMFEIAVDYGRGDEMSGTGMKGESYYFTSTASNWETTSNYNYSVTFSANRPVLAGVVATDEERDAWLDGFEAENGKLKAKQREAFKEAIAGWVSP